MNKETIQTLVKGKFFSVQFVKKNGEIRNMLARLGVKKYLKGGQKSYDYDNLLTVYDVKKKAYRTINLDTLMQLKANGKVVKVQ